MTTLYAVQSLCQYKNIAETSKIVGRHPVIDQDLRTSIVVARFIGRW